MSQLYSEVCDMLRAGSMFRCERLRELRQIQLKERARWCRCTHLFFNVFFSSVQSSRKTSVKKILSTNVIDASCCGSHWIIMLYNKPLKKHIKASTSYGNLGRLNSTLLSAFTEGQQRLIKTTTGEVRCLHRAWKILKDKTHPATVCSPCCNLIKDTKISAAVLPDYRVVSIFRWWDSSNHPPHSAL